MDTKKIKSEYKNLLFYSLLILFIEIKPSKVFGPQELVKLIGEVVLTTFTVKDQMMTMKKLVLLNVNYSKYVEDLYYSYKVRKSGCKLYNISKVEVLHKVKFYEI